MRESALCFTPEVAEDAAVLVASHPEHDVERFRVLHVDGELPASLLRPCIAVASESDDDAGQPAELLGERDRPRSPRS